MSVLDNYCIPRAELYCRELYRDYSASKKRYFYSLKVHWLVTANGQPVEFFLTPGTTSNTDGLEGFEFDLPNCTTNFGDKDYNTL